MPKYAKINCLLSIAVQPRGFFSLSVVNKAVEKTVKACWQLQIPCREVKLSDSYETNNSLLTSSNTTGSVFRSKSHLGWLSLLLVVKCIKCKAIINCTGALRAVESFKMIQDHFGKEYHQSKPMQVSQNYQKGPTSTENNWLLFWKTFSVKIAKNLLWNKIRCFRGFLLLSDVFLCLFLSFFSHFFCLCPPSNLKFSSNVASHLSSFSHLSFLEIPEWIYKTFFWELKSLRRPPSHSASLLSTSTAVFFIATVSPDRAHITEWEEKGNLINLCRRWAHHRCRPINYGHQTGGAR